jgi:diaminopimelate decarboxylase
MRAERGYSRVMTSRAAERDSIGSATPAQIPAAIARSLPAGLEIGPDGELREDEINLRALADERGTPLWVVSRSSIERSFTRLKLTFESSWPHVEIAYAMKANNLLGVVRLLHNLGAYIDASAEYEFQLALLAGVPPGEIILNGNAKSDAALRTAAELGTRQVNIDSEAEVRRLNAIAEQLDVTVPCAVRVQLTYRDLLSQDPSFETTLRLGEGKFGNNLGSGQALGTVRAVLDAPHLEFVGLSHHVGFSGYMADFTAEREVMHHRECTRELCEFANEVRRVLSVAVDRLDLGGGFRTGTPVALAAPGDGQPSLHDLPTAADYADAIFPTVSDTLQYDEPPTLQFESGGHNVAESVIFLTRVVEIKDVVFDRPMRYIGVDGSMMMFVSRGMMRVGHPVLPARDAAAPAADIPVDVVGQTCVYDSIAEDIRLPPTHEGDILAVLNQGAYCETQSTQFNAFPRPEVGLVDRGSYHVLRRREVLADIHHRDSIPPVLYVSRG